MPNTSVRAAAEGMPAAKSTTITGRFSRRAMLGAIAAVPAIGAVAAAGTLPATLASVPVAHVEHPDPLAEAIAEYHSKMAEFMAIPVDEITGENEEALVAATYKPALDRLWHHTPLPTSLHGVREALRYTVEVDGFIDRVAESVAKAALVYLDQEHGL
ncbi:hypothetical protein NKH53_13840 [Mesorhizobium australicum]|uniref:hypothetical protein n=1 Tax=Mesorhizobium australicum TaxID=536018 RepID=UPI00333704BA